MLHSEFAVKFSPRPPEKPRKHLRLYFAYNNSVDPTGISWLFVDLNAYYASVEQQLRPELRRRPIAVVPVEADSACCIAVSYQAKARRVQSGMLVREAKKLCPDLAIVKARPRLYVEYHHRIRTAIECCVPIQQVMSCDEFACRLIGREREPARAIELAHAIKQAIRSVGETLQCSIGLGPNRLLAKMATEARKPDGLTVLHRAGLPHSLHGFSLRDVPGIGERMERRLHAAGITTMRQLCMLSRGQMHSLWRGITGDRLWLWLRGEDFLEPQPQARHSFSRQHILPPDCRNPLRARAIALKLLHAAARRMRAHRLWTRCLVLQVGFAGRELALEAVSRFPPTQSPAVLQQHLAELWKEVPPRYAPSDLTVALCELCGQPQPELFAPPDDAPDDARDNLTPVLDALRARFGGEAVYLGSAHDARGEAPTCISFGPPPPLSEF